MTDSYNPLLEELEQEEAEMDLLLEAQAQEDAKLALTPSAEGKQGPDFVEGASEKAAAQLEQAEEDEANNMGFQEAFEHMVDPLGALDEETRADVAGIKAAPVQGVIDTALGLGSMGDNLNPFGEPFT